MKYTFYLLAVCMLTGCRLGDGLMHTVFLEPVHFADYLEDKSDHRRYRRIAKELLAQDPNCTSKDYERGFKDGFVDFMMAGGTTEAPLLAPRRYWKGKQQTPRGHLAAYEWFTGFEDGAAAAQDGGYRRFATIPSTLVGYAGSDPFATEFDSLIEEFEPAAVQPEKVSRERGPALPDIGMGPTVIPGVDQGDEPDGAPRISLWPRLTASVPENSGFATPPPMKMQDPPDKPSRETIPRGTLKLRRQ